MSDSVEIVDEDPNRNATLEHLFASLKARVESIDSCTQTIALETNTNAKRILFRIRDEEFRSFSINLEFLLRDLPQFRKILKSILFAEGDIMDHIDDVPLLLEDPEPEPELDPEQLLQEYITN